MRHKSIERNESTKPDTTKVQALERASTQDRNIALTSWASYRTVLVLPAFFWDICPINHIYSRKLMWVDLICCEFVRQQRPYNKLLHHEGFFKLLQVSFFWSSSFAHALIKWIHRRKSFWGVVLTLSLDLFDSTNSQWLGLWVNFCSLTFSKQVEYQKFCVLVAEFELWYDTFWLQESIVHP
jgi:hypothetical protein